MTLLALVQPVRGAAGPRRPVNWGLLAALAAQAGFWIGMVLSFHALRG